MITTRSTVWSTALGLWCLVCLLPGVVSPAGAQDLSVSAVGAFRFSGPDADDPRAVAEGISDISYVGGDQFLVVSDLHARIHRLTIKIERTSGAIVAANFGSALELTDTLGHNFPEAQQGPDSESIAIDTMAGVVWVTNERAGEDTSRSSIAAHELATGRMLEFFVFGCHLEAKLFCGTRENQGLEALAYDSARSLYWTANEQALVPDGGPPDLSRGATVRLQQFDAQFHAGLQFVYRTDALSATTPAEVVEWGISGLVELLALPDGNLLALERATVGDSSGRPTVRVRLYEAELGGATDVSQVIWRRGLLAAEESPLPVRKRLLIELTGETGARSNFNFEGMALGPSLANGDRSLILIADNGAGVAQHRYALRIGSDRD